MYAVGRLGSYITRGVYTVSGPFHPFGGAVDIIVVQQPDGSFKSSPWYVRFGKFQGVLKAKENAISISVNGVQANFHMFLDQRGQAYFLREVEGEEGEETVIYNFSSTDDEDGQDQRSGMPRKSQSCNYDESKLIAKDEIDSSNGAILGRNKSRRARILGLVFGRRSIKENSRGEGDDGVGVSRTSSLDRAEMAADLLEVRWSTNLETTPRKRDALPFPASDMLRGMGEINVQSNDEQSEVESSGIDHPSVALEMDSCNEDLGRISNSGMEIMERTVEKTTLHISSLSTIEQDIETSIIDEIILEEKCKVISEISTNIDEPCVQNGNPDDSAEGLISEGPFLNSQTLDVLEICPSKKSDEEPVSGFPVEESGSDGVQSFIYQGTSKSSGVGSDGSSEQTQETPYLNSGGPREVHSCAETLLTTAELLTEDMVDEHTEDTKLNGETIEVCDSCAQQTYSTSPCIHSQDEVSFKLPPTKLDALTVNMDPITGSVEDAESNCLSVISGFSNSDHHLQHEKSSGEYKTMSNELEPSAESVGDSEQFYGDSGPRKEVSTNMVGNSDEEQFLFSDLDEFKSSEVHNESASLDVEGIHSLFGLETTEEVNGPYKTKGEFVSSPKKFDQEDQLAEYVRATSSPIGIHKPSGFADADIERLVESLPNMRSCIDNLDADDSHLPLSQSLESKLNHVVDSHVINTDRQSVDQSVQEASKSGDTQNAEDIKSDFADPPPGDPSIAVVASGGSWIWPFSLKKSKSGDTTQQTQKDMLSSDAKADSGSKIYPEKENTMISSKTTKKMVKATTPTSEQLASLNLKEGKNVVTFTFSTAVVGKQEVDARIYLWKWDTRIVISDVDGTITKSDVLGQFMPLVGVDWSQTGVAHLFSAIKENGYQLLFLSARAISQAYHTRQFLVNLKQDGKALPDGPIVISPDGLFPSLFREVIRRAPHEFKIACLETIKALFPSDYNPFYAGFGNRDTDEISYLKVGIPRGKIFIINPKGEVAVNRRVDTKSYKSLHALVHGMFPSTASSEQEDYNTWNYWKLPPPVIDI